MHPWAILQALVILTVANTSPLITTKVFGARFAAPLDAGIIFFDGRPLLGPSKTIRGVVISIFLTTAVAPLFGVAPEVGAYMACAAMGGDCCSSFVKRRLGMPSSSRALGLDQVPEALLPLLVGGEALGLEIEDMAISLAVFFVGEIVFSRLFYRLRLRDRPY